MPLARRRLRERVMRLVWPPCKFCGRRSWAGLWPLQAPNHAECALTDGWGRR